MSAQSQTALQGFYLSFSGESSNPINNVYALSPSGKTLSEQVLDPAQTYDELRGMAFGPDGKLYVCQAHKTTSAVLQFSQALEPGTSTRSYLGAFVTPSASAGLWHPYQPVYGTDGNLYVSSQDTNVVTCFYGPLSSQAGKASPNSEFLQKSYPDGTFNPGTIIPAHGAADGAPPFTAVPVDQGGLTFDDSGSSTHSVRGLAFDSLGHLYAADEGNSRVSVFDATGTFLGAITQSSNHSVQDPVALCFNPSSLLLYIGSPGDNRVFQYDVTQVSTGNFQANVLIHDSDRLDKLSGIALDADGNLYTCSRKKNKVYQWDSQGNLMSDFAGPFDDSPEQIIPVYTAISG